MEITKDIFEKYVPSAINSDDTLFLKVQAYFSGAEKNLQFRLLGDMTFEALPELVQQEFTKCVVLSAMKAAIPDLDLVLTPTGFGVVSNNNLAPASKERVQNLMTSINQQALDSYEHIIALLARIPEWYKAKGTSLIRSLFWNSSLLAEYCGQADPHFNDLVQLRPSILDAELLLKRRISPKLYDRLVMEDATNAAGIYVRELITLSRVAMALYIQRGANDPQWNKALNDVENFLEDNLAEFPEYQDSAAYRLKHMDTYQNDKHDTTYFFG